MNPESLLDHIQVANCDSDGNCEAVKEKGVRFNSMRSAADGMGMVFGAGVMLGKSEGSRKRDWSEFYDELSHECAGATHI